VQKYTGINKATSAIASGIATIALRKQVGGKAKAKIRTYSFTDFLAGKVKSLDVVLKDSSYRGILMRDVEVHSATPIWFRYFKSKDGKPGVRAPILMKVAGRVHEKDISDTLSSPDVSKALRMVKLSLPGMGNQQLQFLQPKVDI